MNIDLDELNVPRNVPEETAEFLIEARRAPQPIVNIGATQGNLCYYCLSTYVFI